MRGGTDRAQTHIAVPGLAMLRVEWSAGQISLSHAALKNRPKLPASLFIMILYKAPPIDRLQASVADYGIVPRRFFDTRSDGGAGHPAY